MIARPDGARKIADIVVLDQNIADLREIHPVFAHAVDQVVEHAQLLRPDRDQTARETSQFAACQRDIYAVGDVQTNAPGPSDSLCVWPLRAVEQKVAKDNPPCVLNAETLLSSIGPRDQIEGQVSQRNILSSDNQKFGENRPIVRVGGTHRQRVQHCPALPQDKRWILSGRESQHVARSGRDQHIVQRCGSDEKVALGDGDRREQHRRDQGQNPRMRRAGAEDCVQGHGLLRSDTLAGLLLVTL